MRRRARDAVLGLAARGARLRKHVQALPAAYGRRVQCSGLRRQAQKLRGRVAVPERKRTRFVALLQSPQETK